MPCAYRLTTAWKPLLLDGVAVGDRKTPKIEFFSVAAKCLMCWNWPESYTNEYRFDCLPPVTKFILWMLVTLPLKMNLKLPSFNYGTELNFEVL